MLWQRETDEFQLGQWLKGRIYERRSDLSPDGRYFIYFAMKGKPEGDAGGAWTAISRAPFLKALAIFPKGDCYNGGGLWIEAGKYWLNVDYCHTVLRDTTLVQRDPTWEPTGSVGLGCLGVYYPRLMRDGWAMNESNRSGEAQSAVIFEKPCPNGWVLRKIAHAGTSRPGKGCYWDEHELVQPSSGATIACPRWEWAERDGDRLVWATDGRLEAGRLTAQGLVESRTLLDCNGMAFAPISAPY